MWFGKGRRTECKGSSLLDNFAEVRNALGEAKGKEIAATRNESYNKRAAAEWME